MAASGNGNENHDVIENTADMYSSNLHQAINSTVICRAATIQDTCYAHGAQRGKKKCVGRYKPEDKPPLQNFSMTLH